MGWIEHGDASYIEMKNRDIADLRAKVAALEASRNMHALNAVEMMRQRDALEAENGRLRAPVSDAEWEAANYRQAVETGSGESSTGGEMLVWHSYTSRDKFDALIAARAQQTRCTSSNQLDSEEMRLLRKAFEDIRSGRVRSLIEIRANLNKNAQQPSPAQDKEQG